MQPTWLTLFLTAATALCAAPPSFACSVSPQADQVAKELRATINAADYVFIGQIERVTKRRWGPDDQMGWYENQLVGWRAEGRELPEAQERVLIYSDAEARISIKLSMKSDGLERKAGRRSYNDFEVDVDLLHPVRSPGDGLCTSFPMPCPWDVKVGEWVAVALEAQPLGPPDTTYCVRIDHPNLATSDRIRLLRQTEEAAEVFWPFITAANPELIDKVPTDVDVKTDDRAPMRASPLPRPAPNRP